MRKSDWNKPYRCTGENPGRRELGDVGKVKSLGAWVDQFFGESGRDYFEMETPSEVVDYIHASCYKRLKKAEKHD